MKFLGEIVGMINPDGLFFNWFLLPLLIFSARVMDVSMGTMRIISLSRGWRGLTPVLGFFEVMIWLLAIRQIFNHLNNPVCYIAYAGGFATGIFTGMTIERKLAIGWRVVRVITRLDATELISSLRASGFGVTVTNAEGNTGPVKVIFTVVKRADVQSALEAVTRFNPKAFYSVEDVRSAAEGIFPGNGSLLSRFMAR